MHGLVRRKSSSKWRKETHNGLKLFILLLANLCWTMGTRFLFAAPTALSKKQHPLTLVFLSLIPDDWLFISHLYKMYLTILFGRWNWCRWNVQRLPDVLHRCQKRLFLPVVWLFMQRTAKPRLSGRLYRAASTQSNTGGLRNPSRTQ